jgi:hypothetical protein
VITAVIPNSNVAASVTLALSSCFVGSALRGVAQANERQDDSAADGRDYFHRAGPLAIVIFPDSGTLAMQAPERNDPV